MPKIMYKDRNFSASSTELIEKAEAICAEYMAAGYTLTLRQLYYQFVARAFLPNKMSEYKRLGSVINDARIAGLIDWDAIEDRTRNLEKLATWDSPKDILESVAKQFRYDRWEKQPTRVEVWIEKEALVGVIERVCEEYHVPYFACRGYSSQSETWRAGQRFAEYNAYGQAVKVLHLGDHDPSGIDMTRDNDDRLQMFANDEDATGNPPDVEIIRLALNEDQVRRYNPPPNPAKLTDSRAEGYISKFGMQSWELDALDPKVIGTLIRRNIEAHIDDERWGEAIEREKKARDRLNAMAVTWKD